MAVADRHDQSSDGHHPNHNEGDPIDRVVTIGDRQQRRHLQVRNGIHRGPGHGLHQRVAVRRVIGIVVLPPLARDEEDRQQQHARHQAPNRIRLLGVEHHHRCEQGGRHCGIRVIEAHKDDQRADRRAGKTGYRRKVSRKLQERDREEHDKGHRRGFFDAKVIQAMLLHQELRNEQRCERSCHRYPPQRLGQQVAEDDGRKAGARRDDQVPKQEQRDSQERVRPPQVNAERRLDLLALLLTQQP